MYISITDPCISYVNNVNQKEQKKNIFFLRGGGGGAASEIRQTWGGACPKRLKTPGIKHLCFATTLHMKIFLKLFFYTKKLRVFFLRRKI